jgi:hypothetical protein
MEYVTDSAIPLCLIPQDYRHPLAQQFEEIDEDGDLVRSYDEWGLASVLTYAYTRKVATKAEYGHMEEIMGICLEESRHTRKENKDLFREIKRGIKAGNEKSVLPFAKVLISRLGSALAEQHDAMEDNAED